MNTDATDLAGKRHLPRPATVGHLVVGAGLAGLHTAWRLQQRGESCLLLEGRSRIGGRVEAASTPDGESTTIDLGPSWFWPHQQRMRRLLEELDLPWFEQFTRGAALFEQAPGQAPVRSQGAGAPLSFRVRGGTTALTSALAQALAPGCIRLQHRVRQAVRRDDHWELSVETGEGDANIRARALILALPPRQALRFLAGADLPDEITAALARQQTWMSAQAKFVAVFDRPFWRDAGLAGEAFSRVGPMVEIHDASPEEGEIGALFGFLGVPARRRLDLAPELLTHHCCKQLERLFGPDAGSPTFVTLRDWARESLTVTGVDIDEPSTHADFPLDRYEAQLANRGLWLAGSEYASGEPGYLEGAIEASERVLQGLPIESE